MELTIKKAENLKTKPDESQLGFGTIFTDHMFNMDYSPEKGWHSPRIEPYAPINLDPATMYLHYAQGVFEGLKAYEKRYDNRNHLELKMLEGYSNLTHFGEKHADGLSALVCALICSKDKVKFKVENSSGRKPFDRLALNAAQKAVDGLPLPKDVQAARACFRFTARFTHVPPLPFVGCDFDEVLLTARCFYPLGKGLCVHRSS